MTIIVQVFQLGERQKRLVVDTVYSVRFQIPVDNSENKKKINKLKYITP